ncbi:putative asparaginase 2 [Cavenderia fasciculata]|uniref:beta-aspartyl-peptidase n=1 Tax=Cavenderia fasciculata TaxID=261658 RepID=F4PNP4_CACFS|nr:putative asparaginase 2 [Cavenderia fasciculata]EGG23097.1 putative asparaginase 2 [Cavenderia fasciculata]|eukprot:XP_004360948.1 putative asparaginase 2 [Cavenderia fasciculata]
MVFSHPSSAISIQFLLVCLSISEMETTTTSSTNSTTRRPILLIHGGAGTISKSVITEKQANQFQSSLERILTSAYQVLLKDGGNALDAVTEAVRLLEEDPLYNAGKGSVFTSAGTHEMDASIMDGRDLKAGAVGGVGIIRNPVLAARAIMEKTPHVMMIGKGAEDFIRDKAPEIELVDPSFFFTEHRYNQLLNVQKENKHSIVLDHSSNPIKVKEEEEKELKEEDKGYLSEKKFGTVGAVALDINGNLAAATSTGGMTNKLVGRVGDSPIVGSGVYANNKTVAVSTTGTGEMFIRSVASYTVSAMMEFGGYSLEKAAHETIFTKLTEIDGDGGLIAIDRDGNFTMPFNTEGMYRGYIQEKDKPNAFLYGPNESNLNK